MKLLLPVLFCIAAFAVMLIALHYSRYKKRPSGCCGAHDTCAGPHHHHHHTHQEGETAAEKPLEGNRENGN
ncbi:MAG: hypothetical protein GY757_04910 [bacterium]|nr:hypothetical protein [bacterium]